VLLFFELFFEQQVPTDVVREPGETSWPVGGSGSCDQCGGRSARRRSLSEPVDTICPMRADGTFTVKAFVPADLVPDPEVPTGVPVGVATMEKVYEGEVTGQSATLFTAAFDQEAGVGTYVAMESFAGSLHGQDGSFNFAHSATTSGSDRSAEFFVIVPSSGTGELAGISGTGGLAIDGDGTHRIWLDYELG
jgi:Protein of unknown function (DUF3224)